MAQPQCSPAALEHPASRAGMLLFVGFVAVALRLPHLQTVPHLTDETTEVLWAYDIAFHGARPLTHADAYDGPLWPYLLAGVLRTFGSSASLPRLFALALGLATLIATSILAARLTVPGRRFAAGLLASLILAVTFSHAVVASRVAWSNNSTPLWTTLLAIALVAVPRQPHPAWCVATGLLAGAALHSHPSAIAFLLGGALWFLAGSARRASLRSPTTWLAPATALAFLSPVIRHNMQTGFSSLHEAARSSNASPVLELWAWVSAVGAASLQLGRSIVGAYGLDGPVAGWSPLAALYGLLALAAVFALAFFGPAAGRRLPAIVVLTSLAVLPLVNANWQGLLESRYLCFLWPLIASAAAVVVTAKTGDGTQGCGEPRTSQPTGLGIAHPAGTGAGELAADGYAHGAHKVGRAARVVLSVLGAFLLVLPASRVWWFDAAASREQFTSARLWHMVAMVEAQRDGHPAVLVDRELKTVRWRAGGHPRRAVEYFLTLEGVDFVRAPLPKINHLLAENGRYYLFLAGASAAELGRHHRLVELDVSPRPGEEPWGLYLAPGRSPLTPRVRGPRGP